MLSGCQFPGTFSWHCPTFCSWLGLALRTNSRAETGTNVLFNLACPHHKFCLTFLATFQHPALRNNRANCFYLIVTLSCKKRTLVLNSSRIGFPCLWVVLRCYFFFQQLYHLYMLSSYEIAVLFFVIWPST